MRKLILVAAIALLGTSAHAGVALAQTAPAAAPAAPVAQAAPAQTVAPAAPAAKPAKPDRNQMIFEQLVKHGIIKMPAQTQPVPATAAVPAPAAPATTTAV